MAHAGGRPTKYDTQIIEEVYKYLTTDMGSPHLPTVESLSVYLNVDTDTIVEWCKEHKEFSVAIKRLKDIQKAQLINDGLYNKDTSAPMAIFLLKANHGLIETDRREVTGKDGAPLSLLGGASKDGLQANDSN